MLETLLGREGYVAILTDPEGTVLVAMPMRTHSSATSGPYRRLG